MLRGQLDSFRLLEKSVRMVTVAGRIIYSNRS